MKRLSKVSAMKKTGNTQAMSGKTTGKPEQTLFAEDEELKAKSSEVDWFNFETRMR